MVFGCLRRCGMNSSDDDLVAYEKAPREIPRVTSPPASITPPFSPPIHIAPPPSFSSPTDTPHRKITLMDHNDSFVPLLCSTKIAGATGHHRSISLLGGEGSFHDMILHDRCRSLNHLDERPSDGRLLRHDHYSTEKFISTSTMVMIDPSKITEDRTREGNDLPRLSMGRVEVQPNEDRETTHIPMEPVITVTRGPLPMVIRSREETDEEMVKELVNQLVSTTVMNEEREEKEQRDHHAIQVLMQEILKTVVKEEEDSNWRETPLLNETQPLSPIVEERKWKVYEDEEAKSVPISSTPLSRLSSKRINKLKIREDISPLPIDRPLCLQTPLEQKAVQEMKTPKQEERVDYTLGDAPLRPPNTRNPLRSNEISRMGVTFNGNQVHFVKD